MHINITLFPGSTPTFHIVKEAGGGAYAKLTIVEISKFFTRGKKSFYTPMSQQVNFTAPEIYMIGTTIGK